MIELAVCPHPKAPLFPDSETGRKVFANLLHKLQSQKSDELNVELKETMRQAGFVNLWFFLKFVAGATGPFHFLNTGVHLDMCNFRQSDECMREGARVAVFVARGFAKTTIFTEGSTAWELIRSPNDRFRIVNATVDRSRRFKNVVQRIFDSNPVIAELYPEMVPQKNAKRWNENEMVMPNATRFYKEPSLSAGGVEGASEGDHYDMLIMDDIVGMDDVDSDFNPNLKMQSAATWLSMSDTLLNSRMKSREIVVATRYGPGDVYSAIASDCKSVRGFESPSYKPKPDGTWVIYYRHAIENGKAINPFVITADAYAKLLRESPLVAAYQYANDVTISITNEFAGSEPNLCRLVYDDTRGDFQISWLDGKGEEDWCWLSDCNVCISCDWAGSDRKRSTKTSRTSIGVWARNSENKCFRIDQQVGYFSIPDVFDKLFSLFEKWRGYIKATLLEANAMQRGIFDLIVEEQSNRGTWLNIIKKNAKGDKVVRIRSTLGMLLARKLIYVTSEASLEFNEERMAFPSNKLDVLDESEKALSYLATPANLEFQEARKMDRFAIPEDNDINEVDYKAADDESSDFGY